MMTDSVSNDGQTGKIDQAERLLMDGLAYLEEARDLAGQYPDRIGRPALLSELAGASFAAGNLILNLEASRVAAEMRQRARANLDELTGALKGLAPAGADTSPIDQIGGLFGMGKDPDGA